MSGDIIAPDDSHQADVDIIDHKQNFWIHSTYLSISKHHRLLQDIDLTNAGVSGQGRLQRFRLKPFLQDLEGGLKSYFKINSAF